MVEFCTLRGGKKEKSWVISPDFSRGDYDLSRDLLGRITWQMVIERRVQENLIVRDVLLNPKNSTCQKPWKWANVVEDINGWTRAAGRTQIQEQIMQEIEAETHKLVWSHMWRSVDIKAGSQGHQQTKCHHSILLLKNSTKEDPWIYKLVSLI